MNQTATRFTPGQILAAGRRAEADGRFDDAAQFYHHIAEHYRDAPEADDAREAISRLALMRLKDAPLPPLRPVSAFQTRGPSDASTAAPDRDAEPSPDAAPEREESIADVARLAQRLSAQPAPPRPAPAPRAVRSDDPSTAPPTTPLPAPMPSPAVSAEASEHTAAPPQSTVAFDLPDAAPAFLIGRSIGMALTVAGVGLAVIALSSALALVLAPNDARAALARVLEALTQVNGIMPRMTAAEIIAWIPAAILSGFGAALAGQVLSALFATANATRDLAAVRRVEAAFWQNDSS
ncbi:MAG: hypothetical protein AAFR55_02395 [Pseudomonadota bacterium]